jgi:hypothetical protein
MIPSTWWCPASDDREEVILIEVNGIKKYRRVWLEQPPGTDDYTWYKPDNAVRLTGYVPDDGNDDSGSGGGGRSSDNEPSVGD